MANRWTETHDLRNDWRRGDTGGRDDYRSTGGERARYSAASGGYQERSFAAPDRDRGYDHGAGRGGYGDRFADFDRSEGAASRGYGGSADWRGDDDRRVFGERESGADYGGRSDDSRRYGSGYDGDYGRGRGGRYYGDTGRDRYLREESAYGSTGEVHRGRQGYDRPGRDRGYSDAWERGLYGGAGYAGDRGGYGRDHGGYAPNVRDGRGDHNRGFWDRAGDEVSSWFGDRDAERRREWDAAQRGEHRGRGPEGYRRSDSRISDDVHDRLTDDDHLDAGGVRVEVKDGEVTLNGTVRSRACKRRAEDIADNVAGVKHVQNNLRIDEQRGAAGSSATGSAASTTTTAGGTPVSDRVTSIANGNA